jgi:hypothetical protein
LVTNVSSKINFLVTVNRKKLLISGHRLQHGYALVNRAVNDVAMTVLPNAPIDAATGLPVPTIAVATDGGVSVIKDDGTVVDINVTGAELVTNGTFDSDVSGWAGETDTTATYDSGRLKVTKTVQSGPYGIARTDVTTVVGKQYLFQADSITGSGPSAFFRFNDGGLGAYTETEGTTHRAYFTATSTNTRVALGVASTAANAYIFWDNVSVQA